MGKTAVILGATGLTGGMVLDLLLNDPRYSKIRALSRRSLGAKHSKLEEYIINMEDLNSSQSLFIADELYCCIGSTKAKTPDEEAYRRIDFGIPVHAARICKDNGVTSFLVISSLGADVKSKIFYSRLKGEMESAVRNYGIKKTVILRPSLIGGQRQEKRPGEQIGQIAMKLVNPFLIGPLKVYRTIDPGCIAKAMVWLANNPTEKPIFLSDELQQIAADEY